VLVIGEGTSENPEIQRAQSIADTLFTWTEIIERGEQLLSTYRDDPWRSAGAD